MRRIVKNCLFTAILMAGGMISTSCEDWTDPESIDIHYPTFEEQNPQLYADYLKDLKLYKAEGHKVVFVSFNNPGNPRHQSERLTVVPDSVDFICLNNPENLSGETQAEMVKIREKAIRTRACINYDDLENEWNKKAEKNPELTEEEARKYLNERTDALLALCDGYGYDGILVSYTGRSMVGMKEIPLQQYKERQQNFFSKVMSWQAGHIDKMMVFYGNVQYLDPENMDMLDKYNYLILKTTSSTNQVALTMNAMTAIQAGKEAAGTNTNPVPTDRFIAATQLPLKSDADMLIGYWNTKGDRSLAAQGTARWIVQASTEFTRSGIFVDNIQEDYFNNTYASVREVIQIMNPNK